MIPFLLNSIPLLLAVQLGHSVVAGTVSDASTGTPLAGAVVSTSPERRTAITDADGRYELSGVPSGESHISVRLLGYSERSLQAIVPPHGRIEISVSLNAAPIPLQPIEVRAPVDLPGARPSPTPTGLDPGATVTQLRNHPLLAEPDLFQVFAGGEVGVQPETPAGVHIRGGATDQTAYLLDGIPVFSPYHVAGVFSAWNPDAISSVELVPESQTSPVHALSGTIEAVTRPAGTRFRAQGSTSTSQTRVTLDGPVGSAGAGYLVSFRSDFPAAVAPSGENSFVRGSAGDRLVKLELPAFQGRARFLGYDSGNDVSTALRGGEEPGVNSDTRRNRFHWESQSLGLGWNRTTGSLDVRLLGWGATSGAGSYWSERTRLAAARRDAGFRATLRRGPPESNTTLGILFEWSHTTYAATPDSNGDATLRLQASTPVGTAFVRRSLTVGPRGGLEGGVTAATADRRIYLSPQTRLTWKIAPPLTLSGRYARTHQFAQSLRNPESIVGYVFPVDLYLGAGSPEVPVARDDQYGAGLEYSPAEGVRFIAQGYLRGSTGVLLVAPRNGQPFATGALTIGSSGARGFSIQGALSRPRFGLMANYGFQRVRLNYGPSEYAPGHGAAHTFEGGVTLNPTTSSSIRLGATGALGRRTTRFSSGFEWEACNLLDRGCEFGGSPDYRGETLGGTPLPAYLRVDAGFRKSWRFALGGHEASLALFGTVTNLLNRKNVLTYARNPTTGALDSIDMRPLAPLVIGLDWRF